MSRLAEEQACSPEATRAVTFLRRPPRSPQEALAAVVVAIFHPPTFHLLEIPVAQRKIRLLPEESLVQLGLLAPMELLPHHPSSWEALAAVVAALVSVAVVLPETVAQAVSTEAVEVAAERHETDQTRALEATVRLALL